MGQTTIAGDAARPAAYPMTEEEAEELLSEAEELIDTAAMLEVMQGDLWGLCQAGELSDDSSIRLGRVLALTVRRLQGQARRLMYRTEPRATLEPSEARQ